MTHILGIFSAWLGGTSLSTVLAEYFWIVPTLQIIHIIAVATVLIGVLLINLRLLGVVERGQPVAVLLDRFLPSIAIALAVLAVTGGLLIASEPTRAIFRSAFWLKMALILLAAALTWSHRFAFLAGAGTGRGASASPARKGIALLALLAWLGVIVAGRWIAYGDPWAGAPA